MKVAITSTGNDLESKLDNHFGRCSFFVVIDTNTHSMEFIPNPYKDKVEGAGPSSVELVCSRDVKKVISGEFGEKVKAQFDKMQIQLIVLHERDITIREIVSMLNSHK